MPGAGVGDQAIKDKAQVERGRRRPEGNGKGADTDAPVVRLGDDRQPMSASEALQLQRTIGNRATGRVIGPSPDSAQQPAASRPASRRGPLRAPSHPAGGGAHVQRKDTQYSVAKITNYGVSVIDAVGDSGQLGHAMNVWVEIDAGKDPVAPPNAPPNSVYGLEFEYWEYVNVPYDNKGGIGEKPWNDIHGMKPDAKTFDKAAPGCSMTWTAAVAAATKGTLTGKHRIGFQDVPGLWEKPGRNAERTLKFRIVFNDGTPREIFATQLLRINNGRLGYSSYIDSKGNKLESHGFAANAGYQAGSATEKAALAKEKGRLTPDSVPTKGHLTAALPLEAKIAVPSFVVDAVAGKAEPYIDLELLEFAGKVDAARQVAASDQWVDIFSKAFLGDVPGGIAAGQFLIPLVPGTRRVQKKISSGGVLVAIVTGNTIRRLYYTDNSTKSISMDVVPALQEKHWTINLRSFTEIPIELAKESLGVVAARSGGPAMKNMPLTGEDSHLRAFDQQGANVVVRVGTTVGSKIKQGKDVSVFQPEQRDVTGEWLKAQYGGKTGYVRANKLNGVSPADSWKRAEKGPRVPDADNSAGVSVKAYFEDELRAQGNSYQVYGRLLASHPGLESFLAEIYKKVYGDSAFRQMELTRHTASAGHDITEFSLSAYIYDGDHAGLIADVMTYLNAFPGRGDRLESVYNQHIPPLGLDVPATLGEIVNEHFLTKFRTAGGSFAVYNQLATDFPDFTYRLKPAYRQVFGEAQLNTMLQQGQATANAAADGEHSQANMKDYLAFIVKGVFSLQDFVPTAGAGTGKFDATYNPITDDLDITVRVCYQFVDSAETPADTSKEAAGFGQQFGQKTWTDQAKANWKSDYEASATGAFNKGSRMIKCTRPGWDFTAKPKFHVREVALGQQHFIVQASKAVLMDKGPTGGGKAMTGGSAGAGQIMVNGVNVPSVDLREYDVYDKFKDPRLHTYLHSIESSTNVEPAYSLDRKRLEDALARLGVIPVRKAGSAAAVRGSVSKLADGLKRLEIPSSLATLHPIVAKGMDDGQGGAEGGRSAAAVKQELTNMGVKNPTETADTGGTADDVIVAAKPVDPAIQATYVTNWSRFTSAHEYGHMIGLIDEYVGAGSAETVKGMISAGWLPADTRADHLKLNPPKDIELAEKAAQEATQSLYKRTGLESPDYAMNAPGNAPKSTSLMTGGFDVRDVHMITAWEALVAMTSTYVNEKYWKIS
jgi:hypothetical protein